MTIRCFGPSSRACAETTATTSSAHRMAARPFGSWSASRSTRPYSTSGCRKRPGWRSCIASGSRRPGTAVVVITGQGTIDAAVEAMKAGATDFVEKPYEVDALRRTLRTVQEEQHARTLLGASAADGAVVRVLSDAVARRALWAVVGPRADPPSGATRVFRVEEEGPSTDRLRTEPALSAQHRNRHAKDDDYPAIGDPSRRIVHPRRRRRRRGAREPGGAVRFGRVFRVDGRERDRGDGSDAEEQRGSPPHRLSHAGSERRRAHRVCPPGETRAPRDPHDGVWRHLHRD